MERIHPAGVMFLRRARYVSHRLYMLALRRALAKVDDRTSAVNFSP